MHDTVRAFVEAHADELGYPILELGSADVNGTIRDLFSGDVFDGNYLGLDVVDAEGVDYIYDGETIPFPDDWFATVLCLETFEHCADPVRLAGEICRVLAPDGRALITARGPTFGYHNPPDRWRFMQGALAELFARHGRHAIETPDPLAPGSGWFVEVT